MRTMHGCNEDVLIGMNGSYCREGEKCPESFSIGVYGHAAIMLFFRARARTPSKISTVLSLLDIDRGHYDVIGAK